MKKSEDLDWRAERGDDAGPLSAVRLFSVARSASVNSNAERTVGSARTWVANASSVASRLTRSLRTSSDMLRSSGALLRATQS